MELPSHILAILEECSDGYKAGLMSPWVIANMCEIILNIYNDQEPVSRKITKTRAGERSFDVV